MVANLAKRKLAKILELTHKINKQPNNYTVNGCLITAKNIDDEWNYTNIQVEVKNGKIAKIIKFLDEDAKTEMEIDSLYYMIKKYDVVNYSSSSFYDFLK